MKASALIFNSKNIRKFNKYKANKSNNDLFINIAIFITFTLVGGIFLLYRYNSKLNRINENKKNNELNNNDNLNNNNLNNLDNNNLNNNNLNNNNLNNLDNNNLNNNEINKSINNINSYNTEDLSIDEDKYYFL